MPDPELTASAPPSPVLPDAQAILSEHFGLTGTVSQIDGIGHSYSLDDGEKRYRLEIVNKDERERSEFETELLIRLASDPDAPNAPQPTTAGDGTYLVALETPDAPDLYARLLALPEGLTLPASAALSDTQLLDFGSFLARLAQSLTRASEDLPSVQSRMDLRHAGPRVVQLLRTVTDHDARDPIAKAMVAALRSVQPLGPELRVQSIYHQPSGDNLLWQKTPRHWHPASIVNPELLGDGWLIAMLAQALADAIRYGKGDPFDLLPMVAGFHVENPLQKAELKCLWPLTIACAGLDAAEMERRLAIGEIARDSLELLEAQRVFAIVTEVPQPLMEAAIFDALGWPDEPAPDFERLLPDIAVEDIRLTDLSVTSPHFAEGNWNDPDIDWRLLARTAWDTRMGATRYAEYRLSHNAPAGKGWTDNMALHVDLCVPAGALTVAPFGGILKETNGRIVLSGKEATLYLEGLETTHPAGTALFSGDALGVVGGAEGSVGGLRIMLCRDADLVPPLFAPGRLAGAWSRLCLSPSPVLGINVDAPPLDPAAPTRGWKEFLFDGQGRRFIDLSGAAGFLGYGHPALAEAAYRQWLLLNGTGQNQAEAEFRQSLLRLMPGGLDTVLAVTTPAGAWDFASALIDAEPDDQSPLVIADERRTGFGMIGDAIWQFAKHGDLPDIVVTPSPVPGEPLAAVIAKSAVLDDLRAVIPPPLLPTAVACRIGSAIIDTILAEDLASKAAVAAAQLRKGLHEISTRYPALAAIEGEGLNLDLVFDRTDPLDIAAHLAASGILVARSRTPGRLSLSPPLEFGEESISVLQNALALALAALPSAAEEVTSSLGDQSAPLQDRETVSI